LRSTPHLKFYPMSNSRERIALTRTFTEDEFLRLSQSLQPETMDRRWYGVLDCGWLHIIRSWTDRCIFQLKVRTTAPHHVIKTWMSRDKRRYRNAGTTQEIGRLNQAIDEILTTEGESLFREQAIGFWQWH
jgi:hypothetical protein